MRRAFTLIELSVALAIVGVMISLAVALGSDTVALSRVREDIELVRGQLVDARNHARRHAVCVEVRRVDAQTLRTRVHTDVGAGCPAAAHATAPPRASTTLRSAAALSQFDVAGVPHDTIVFRPDGSVPLANPATIRLMTSMSSTALAVWPAAGIVKRVTP
jgi:prepilin-type N-terminal cleavage/methylation domain-containing protein